MASILDFLKSQAKKAGLTNNAEFDALLTENADALSAIQLPTLAHNLINEGLFGMTEAQANPKLKEHFNTRYANGVEQKFIGVLKKAGMTDEKIEEIVSGGDSFSKRIELSESAIEKHLAEIKKGSGKEGNEEMKRLLAEADNKVKTIQAEKDKEITTLKTQMIDRVKNQAFDKRFGALKIKGMNDLPQSAKSAAMKALVENWLKENNGALDFDEEKEDFVLKNATDKTLDFTPENKVYNFDDFLSLNLQKNNLLDTDGGGSPNPDGIPKLPPNGNEGAASKPTTHQLNTMSNLAAGLAASMGG